MQNVKNLYASNKALEEEIENHKKSALEKVISTIFFVYYFNVHSAG